MSTPSSTPFNIRENVADAVSALPVSPQPTPGVTHQLLFLPLSLRQSVAAAKCSHHCAGWKSQGVSTFWNSTHNEGQELVEKCPASPLNATVLSHIRDSSERVSCGTEGGRVIGLPSFLASLPLTQLPGLTSPVCLPRSSCILLSGSALRGTQTKTKNNR